MSEDADVDQAFVDELFDRAGPVEALNILAEMGGGPREPMAIKKTSSDDRPKKRRKMRLSRVDRVPFDISSALSAPSTVEGSIHGAYLLAVNASSVCKQALLRSRARLAERDPDAPDWSQERLTGLLDRQMEIHRALHEAEGLLRQAFEEASVAGFGLPLQAPEPEE